MVYPKRIFKLILDQRVRRTGVINGHCVTKGTASNSIDFTFNVQRAKLNRLNKKYTNIDRYFTAKHRYAIGTGEY